MPRVLVALLVLACASRSFANNLAADWIDRVTHEVEKEQGPLSKRPLDFHVYTGVYGYYTDNLFLASNHDADGDSAVIGFARARADYAGSELEISADLLVNFDYFMEHQEAREDEERFYGKIRWTDGVWDLQFVQIARRESDALDAIFTKKARRLVCDSLPRAGLKLADLITLEAFAQIEIVRFEGDEFDGRESESYRGGLAILGDVTPRITLGAEVGFIGIHYRQEETTPSAEGIFARGVFRGEPVQRLLVEASVGWAGIRAQDPGDPDDERKRGASTFDAEVHVRYEVAPTVMLFGDYVRQYGFAGFGDPYQQVDRFIAIAEWEALKGVKLRARGQFDHVRPSEFPRTIYWSGTLSATWQIIANFAVDVGVTYRGGKTRSDDDRSNSYDNWIGYVGAILSF